LDVEGTIETARRGVDDAEVMDERKIDQVVGELNRYKVDVAALQETKWFGNGVYEVGGSVVLAAGRPVPGEGMVKQRGEGVAIVLSGAAIGAWKTAGKCWKAWGSRLLSVKLKVAKGNTDSSFLHVLCCYAPTFAASREEKNAFFDLLQQALATVPDRSCYVVLGDFNARVGSREGDDDTWWHERGPHGHGVLNEAGRELLSFLSINGATVCNTWFVKKAINKQTWQHPKSKQWHCIDYAMMRKSERWRCLDAMVVRGAQCNTDHMMLRVKVLIGKKPPGRQQEKKAGRFDVARLSCGNVGMRGERGKETVREKFVAEVSRRLKDGWCDEESVEEKWPYRIHI